MKTVFVAVLCFGIFYYVRHCCLKLKYLKVDMVGKSARRELTKSYHTYLQRKPLAKLFICLGIIFGVLSGLYFFPYMFINPYSSMSQVSSDISMEIGMSYDDLTSNP